MKSSVRVKAMNTIKEKAGRNPSSILASNSSSMLASACPGGGGCSSYLKYHVFFGRFTDWSSGKRLAERFWVGSLTLRKSDISGSGKFCADNTEKK